jgi:hypothetical protein
VTEGEEAYPNWPYVENIWKNVDRIVEDLVNDDDTLLEKEIPVSGQPDPLADVLSRFSLNNLMEDDSYIHNLPPYSFIEKPTQLASNEEWTDLKKQYGFFSSDSEDTKTSKPPGQVFFDPFDQPETQAYEKNPAIIIAKRNITTAEEILDYLGSLMKTTGDNPPETDERDTTTRSFFIAGLMPEPLQELSKLKGSEKTTISQNNIKNSLTAEDIYDAAQERAKQSLLPLTSKIFFRLPVKLKVLFPYESLYIFIFIQH